MSSSSTALFRRASHSARHRRDPSWRSRRAAYLLPAAAVAAIVVAAHGHHPSAAAAPAATPAPAAVDAAATTRVQPSVSRSLDRNRATKHRAHQRHAHQQHTHQRPQARHEHAALAPSSAARTVATAEGSDYNVPGQCLQWSREQAGIPSRYATAADAWLHATGRHPGDLDPPRGAAVYWTGGSSGAGHIAISVGHHSVRSSDAGGSGEVATVPITQLTAEWHLTYAGWADSINGYTIPGVADR